jgi:hypothetical protein
LPCGFTSTLCSCPETKEEALKFIEHSFRLEAPEGLGRYPRPDFIGPLLTRLPETIQDAVRMGFLNSSRAKGRISDALKSAAQVRFVGVDADGEQATLITFRLPRFGEAAPELFAQGKVWDDGPSADDTAFDLLGLAVRDVAIRKENSQHFDTQLLRRVSAYETLLNKGLTRISLPSASRSGGAGIDHKVAASARELSRVTPAPRRVRVAGRLDLMGASQGVLKLHLQSGQIITALWSGTNPIEQHRESFNRDVVVEGLGVFRASGALLRIEADALVPATQQDEFFRQAPSATPASDYQQLARRRPGEVSAYAKLHGSVLFEESDDAFLAALETVR